MLIQNVIYITLNLAFGLALLVYISSALGSSYIQEQALAKKIALAIDEAHPDMTISINIENGFQALGKKYTEAQKNKTIYLGENTVTVNLGSQKGYSFKFFTDAKIKSQIVEDKYLWVTLEAK